MDVISVIKRNKIVAVIRAESKEKALRIVKACIAGGLSIIEITYTTPQAGQIIETLHNTYGEEIVLGAGTVLDKETAKDAINHGALFVVSPGFDLKTAEFCMSKNIEYIPGCMTITEMLNARKSGANMIKLFPGNAFKQSFIKAVKGPLPNINVMPTGGVNTGNIKSWFEQGASAVGVGSSLTKPAKNNDYESITKVAKEFFKIAKEI